MYNEALGFERCKTNRKKGKTKVIAYNEDANLGRISQF
jgi:hypothetical protein